MGDGQSKAMGARPLQAPSVAELDKRLGIRKRARADAAADQPGDDAAGLSQTERDILDAVMTERARLDAARNDAKADAERRLRALAPAAADISGPTLEARLALRQAASRSAHDWAEVAARSSQAQSDLAAFKRAHELRRAAVYPASTLLQTGLLLCAALFEALFSAALFAEDDERGLLGGAITAIGLSGANVTLGFLAGFLGLRYIQHRRLPMKSAGAVAFAALTLLALMLNLFAADWRDQLAALAGRQLDLGSDAGFHLWSLLSLESPQAVILLMLGAGVWAFAALKGYSGFDDPYPDFGKMDRAARNAADDLSDFRAEARAEFETPIDAAKTAIGARIEKMRGEYEAMSKAFDSAALRMEQLDAQARTLDELAAAAVHLYRQENTGARKTSAPAYFAVPPPASGPALDALAGVAALIDEARQHLGKAQADAAAALEGLLAELEQATAQHDLDAQA